MASVCIVSQPTGFRNRGRTKTLPLYEYVSTECLRYLLGAGQQYLVTTWNIYDTENNRARTTATAVPKQHHLNGNEVAHHHHFPGTHVRSDTSPLRKNNRIFVISLTGQPLQYDHCICFALVTHQRYALGEGWPRHVRGDSKGGVERSEMN